jgi:hypothetical protein
VEQKNFYKKKEGKEGGVNMKKKNWIKGAIKNPGALRKTLGVKKGQKIPAKKLNQAAKGIGVSKKTAQRARLAKTLRGMRKR